MQTTESELRDQEHRAHRAKLLLDNELLNEALKAIELDVFTAWKACPARDQEGKEELWKLIRTKEKFESILKGYIETGKLATNELHNRSISSKIKQAFK